MRRARALVWLVCFLSFYAGNALDLYDASHLKSTAERLARGRELILFSFGHEPNEVLRRMWLYMAVAFVKNLQDFGYTHVLALAHDGNECAALAAGFAGTEVRAPECGWSTVTRKTSGYLGGNSVRALWVQRYHTAAALAELGYNVLMMDVDCYVTRDVYPLLDAIPWHHKYVFMRESPVNGGLFYLRNVTASSPSLWLLKQVERRSTLYAKYRAEFPEAAPPGLPMDQDVLSALFRVTSTQASTYDFFEDHLRSENKEHPLWRDYPQTTPTTPFEWVMTTERHSAPWAEECSQDADACERRSTYVRRHGFKDVQMHTIRVCVPFDDDAYDERVPCETALAGPAWLWSHGDIFECGFDDTIAVTHLLGVNKNWFNMLAGSHMGRWALLVARAGVKTAPLTAKKRVYLSKSVVEHRMKFKDARPFKLLLKHLAMAANAIDAVPVMPAFPCDAPWVERGDDTRLGYKDHRVIDDGALCYPAPMGWDSCLVGEHYLYEFQAPDARPGDEVLGADNLQALNATSGGAQGMLTAYCRELFDVDS